MVFKIDFEKAYDKVNWNFLFKSLELSGFNSTWCGWMNQITRGGTLCVRINNSLGRNFGTFKGIRQGDPISPLLFNSAGDVIARMFRKAQENGLIRGLVPHILHNGITSICR